MVEEGREGGKEKGGTEVVGKGKGKVEMEDGRELQMTSHSSDSAST